MNLRKHLFGLAIFSVIVLSAVLVKAYLTTTPAVTTRHITVLTVPEPPFNEQAGAFEYKVRLVSLDFINKQSYVALELKRGAGQPAPERLWVTTLFFLPGREQEVWSSVYEVRQPFAKGDRFNFVATGSCSWCNDVNVPRAGYFARVYVTTDMKRDQFPPNAPFEDDLRTATPVIVQAESRLKSIP